MIGDPSIVKEGCSGLLMGNHQFQAIGHQSLLTLPRKERSLTKR